MNTANNKINDKDPIAAAIAFRDMVDERLTKIQAILNCLLAAWDSPVTLDLDTIYNTLWLMHDYVQEITGLKGHLNSTLNSTKEECYE